MDQQIMAQIRIPFNKPYLTGNEIEYIRKAHALGQLAGNGVFTHRAQAWLETNLHCKRVLLTHSCTAALEMAALLLDLKPGDEIIMPSYTFVSTANAFALRGAVPVFIDIRPDTLNIDEQLIEPAITERTRAIVPVHYAGVACQMDTIMQIAKQYELIVIEDAAQAIGSSFQGRALGSIGHLGALSFHETKNIQCGEGGALIINEEKYIERAEIIWQKGTNRMQFARGGIEKYSWMDLGSSFLPGEIMAAFLMAQLQSVNEITMRRKKTWCHYEDSFTELKERYAVQRFGHMNHSRRTAEGSIDEHNAHMYYLQMETEELRKNLQSWLQSQGILSVIHYVPLHNSPAGLRFGRCSSSMENTERIGNTLLRLPFFVEIKPNEIDEVIHKIKCWLDSSPILQLKNE